MLLKGFYNVFTKLLEDFQPGFYKAFTRFSQGLTRFFIRCFARFLQCFVYKAFKRLHKAFVRILLFLYTDSTRLPQSIYKVFTNIL